MNIFLRFFISEVLPVCLFYERSNSLLIFSSSHDRLLCVYAWSCRACDYLRNKPKIIENGVLMKNLCVFGVGDFAGSSAWKGLTIPSLCTISLACFDILTFCSVSSCRSLSNKIGFTRFGVSTQKLFSFRLCCSSVTGSTGHAGGTTARNFRSHFRNPVPLTIVRFWSSTEVAPEVGPELPVYRKYRWSQRYYRPELPVPTSGTSAAALLLFSGSGTGTCSGTTVIPELPVVFPVLPGSTQSKL